MGSPRLCGEKSRLIRTAHPMQGSPPAYVGKSVLQYKDYQKFWDHPRLCGEKSVRTDRCENTWGSPPPMRGKAKQPFPLRSHSRITPAYAGKSFCCLYQKLCNGDHPRLCGEKLVVEIAHSGDRGSPPPMRGKAASNRVDMDSAGITPAYAGKSLKRLRIDFKGMDHPRLCGEKLTA